MNRQIRAFRSRPSISLIILVALAILGLVVAVLRYVYGIGAVSNMNDDYAWGMWIGFDLMSGVALAAGGFTTAGAVYVLGLKRFQPLARPAILTAFLGYSMVIVTLLVDIGRPERIWHMIVYWNPHSVMFEVGWCVMLYTTVLLLEFSPLVLERLGLSTPLRLIHSITIPLVIFGIVLSTLHQSSLGSLFLIVPDQLYPLWHSALLPVLFFLSALAVGPSMVIFESSLSSWALKRGFEVDLLARLGKVVPYVLGLYLIAKFGDLAASGKLNLLFLSRQETFLFWAEIVGGVVAPMILFSLPSVRQSRTGLFVAATLVVGGVVLNRLDVGLLALARPEGALYFPHWMEFAMTAGIISAGTLVYWAVARWLPLYSTQQAVRTAAVARGELGFLGGATSPDLAADKQMN